MVLFFFKGFSAFPTILWQRWLETLVRAPGMETDDRVWRERGLRSAVLAGDERAWETWYQESFDSLFAFISWRCAGQRQLIEEVTQDVWLTAIRKIRSFDPEKASFASWLCGLGMNIL